MQELFEYLSESLSVINSLKIDHHKYAKLIKTIIKCNRAHSIYDYLHYKSPLSFIILSFIHVDWSLHKTITKTVTMMLIK